MIRLNNFSFKIAYRQGRIHNNADALSRWPITKNGKDIEEEETDAIVYAIHSITKQDVFSGEIDNLVWSGKEQEKDENIRWIKEIIQNPERKSKAKNLFQRMMLKKIEKLFIKNETLMINEEQKDERYYRPGLKRCIEEFVKRCDTCQKAKRTTKQTIARLKTLKPTRPMQLVAMDIIGPLPATKEKNKYVLAICDHNGQQHFR
jgi:hypothetical protein